jgi:hypothetical protein
MARRVLGRRFGLSPSLQVVVVAFLLDRAHPNS